MSGYIGPSPVPQSIQRRQTFTATASQTTFGTSGYTDGDFIDVYLNGVKLVGGTDYTATNGSDIVLTTGAGAGDILDFVTFNSFQLNAPSFDDSLTLQNTTEEDTDGGRESTIIFKGEQSGGEISTLAEIEAAHDGTADDEKGDLIFRTNDGADGSAPTERLRIDSAGKVGIGTTSPASLMHLEGDTPVITLRDTSSYSAGTGPYVQFQGLDSGSNNRVFGQIYGLSNGSNSGELAFYTRNSGTTAERMRIDSSGNLLVGTTGSLVAGARVRASSIAATFEGEVTHASGSGAVLWANRTSSDGWVAAWYRGGSSVGSVSVTSSSTAYNTSSDYRLKEDVQPMTGASDRVLALNPVNFAWKVDGTRVDGFLAHEAQAVVPEAVTGTKDAMRDEEYEVTPAVYEDVVIPAVLDDEGNEIEPERTEQRLVSEAVMGTRSVPDYQGIDQSKLVPLLTAALQEAIAKIETLETEMTSVKSRLDALENPA